LLTLCDQHVIIEFYVSTYCGRLFSPVLKITVSHLYWAASVAIICLQYFYRMVFVLHIMVCLKAHHSIQSAHLDSIFATIVSRIKLRWVVR